MLLSSSLTVMAGAILAPGLPSIGTGLNVDEKETLALKLILTLPGLFIAILSPVAGTIADKLGRKNLLLGGLILYALGGCSGLIFDNLTHILIGRAVLGCGVAAIMTAATTLIGDYFVGPERRSFLGLQASFMAFGGVVFLTVGGFLADINWRLPFSVYSFSLFLFPFALLFIKETKEDRLAHTSVVKEKLGKSQTQKVGFIYLLGLMGMSIFYMIPIQLPFLMRSLLPVGNGEIAIVIATSTIFAGLASSQFPKIKSVLSYPMIYVASLSLQSIGFLLVSYSENYWVFLVCMVISGLGSGLIMPNSNLWLMELGPESLRGRLIGGMASFIFLGQFLSPIVTQPFIAHFGIAKTFFFASGYMLVLSGAIYLLFRIKTLNRPSNHPISKAK